MENKPWLILSACGLALFSMGVGAGDLLASGRSTAVESTPAFQGSAPTTKHAVCGCSYTSGESKDCTYQNAVVGTWDIIDIEGETIGSMICTLGENERFVPQG